MKKIILPILLLSSISYGQIKLYPKQGTVKRAKATVLELETPPVAAPPAIQSISILVSGTVAATLAPFVVDYGLELVTSLTERKEADYSAEIVADDALEIDFSTLKTNQTEKFNSNLKYYERGKNVAKVAATYNFDINLTGDIFTISLSNATEALIPVKARKRKDFIFETFEFTLTADMSKTLNGNVVHSKINLGTAKIRRQIISYKDGAVNSIRIIPAKLIISKYDNKGQPRNIETLYLTLKQTYLNPYGLSTNTFNSYLENSKDNTSSLLKEILVGSDD